MNSAKRVAIAGFASIGDGKPCQEPLVNSMKKLKKIEERVILYSINAEGYVKEAALNVGRMFEQEHVRVIARVTAANQ